MASAADTPPAAPTAPESPAAPAAPAAAAPTAQAAPSASAPTAQAAPATPAAPTAPAPAPVQTPDNKAVDPQSQIVHSGSPDHPDLGIPALDLKEDIKEVCDGAPILPFHIGTATTLKEVLVKLHLMDVLTQVCAVENTVGQAVEKLTGPGGLLDLDALLR